MSAISDLNSVAFHVLGEPVKFSDMTGNILGLAALGLGWRRSLWTWPVQLASGVVLVSAYASAQLSGGVGKQLVIIVTAIWGWRAWRGGRHGAAGVAVRFATWRERAVLLALAAAGTGVVGGLFLAFPSLSWNPWPDAYIFVGTLVAMIAQSRAWVEFWFAWIAVDLVGVPLALSSGLTFSALVYVVYFVLVLLGLHGWWQRSRAGARPARTPLASGAGHPAKAVTR